MAKRIIYILIIVALFLKANLFAQDEDINLNLLKTPSSTGFVILGIEPTSIERPADPNSFKLSILNATENLSTLPKNYALEFAPGWLFGGQTITAEKFNGNKIWDNIKQSTVISFGIITSKNADSVEGSSVGIGFKSSLFRGELIDDAVTKLNKSNRDTLLARINRSYSKDFAKVIDSDSVLMIYDADIKNYIQKISEEQKPEIIELYRKLLREMGKQKYGRIDELKSQFDADFQLYKKKEIDRLKKLASEMKFDRTGFKLDIAGGIAIDFPDRRINYSKVSKAGLWLTTGYDFKEKISLLFVGRLLASPDNMVTNSSGAIEKKTTMNVDIGTRIIIERWKNISLSGEAIYRRLFDDNVTEKDKLKYVIITNYEIQKNIMLGFSIGKEFEPKPNGNGDLILGLNLSFGLGNERPF